jgi:hypothetical protein
MMDSRHCPIPAMLRNTGLRGYRHDQAQRKSIARRQATAKQHKMIAELLDKN